MRELLNGVIDIHVHGSPSVAPRVETWGFLREMDEAGYRAMCLKEHFIPTVGIADTIAKADCAPKTQVIGSVVLNNALGGLNLMALDTARLLGAKQVFFPTVSAQNHCDFLKTVDSFGGGGLSLAEKPISVLDKNGELIEEAVAVIDYMRKFPELALSMGHLSASEIDVLLPYALSKGIKKLVVDHPYFIIGASVEQVARWSALGAYINFTCSSLRGIGQNGKLSLNVLEDTLAKVPEGRLVISTDYGQPYNGSPVDGMYAMIKTLYEELHVSESRISLMTRETPAMLLGIE